ncbi:MAG TPA: DUF3427 domain-containing protein [Thermoanaerobaculia bacterium]|nr:DUF3427 domain-containing protein [Thermoanaerobaculia bacterium]
MRRAWLLLSFGDERQYAGNPGYLDEPRRLYRYDSFVPNHKQVQEGDYVFIRDKHRLQGVARIEKINPTDGEKLRSRCPVCGKTGIKARKSLSPRYRCDNKHEFDTPDEGMVSCRLYSAEYGNTFVPAPAALPLQELKDACPRYSGQLAIQEIAWERLVPKLMENHPDVQILFSENGGGNKGVVVEEAASVYSFVVGEAYTRQDIYEVVGVPKDLRGGDWETGYHRHEDSYFLFVNVGLPGRTGHDYTNQFEGDRLIWYGKTSSRLSHPSIQALLEPGRNVYVFYRTQDRQPFTYAGLGRPIRMEDRIPVQVFWSFDRTNMVPPEQFPQEVPTSQVYYEGAVTRVLVNAYERNAAARKACIASWECKCWVCGFDFEAVYGELGQGFIHVHHLKPLSEIGSSYQLDPVLDLRPVCPNCHAMLHRKVPALTLDELKHLLRNSTNK